MITGVNGRSGPLKPAASASPANDRLRGATEEFEAFFVEMLLRQAREGARSISGEQPGFARQTQESWQDAQLARSIAQSGGLGIGELLFIEVRRGKLKTPRTLLF